MVRLEATGCDKAVYTYNTRQFVYAPPAQYIPPPSETQNLMALEDNHPEALFLVYQTVPRGDTQLSVEYGSRGHSKSFSRLLLSWK